MHNTAYQFWLTKYCEVLDKQGYAGILLTDLSKAFNCINHELLIAKLHAYGFSLESLTFIQSYLSNRIRRVKINSLFSEYSNVESGVPRELIFGPIFFNIFICDLFFDDTNIDLGNQADDTTPYAYDLEHDKLIKSHDQKLLGILFNNKFDFDEQVTSLCRKASQKLNAFARIAYYMNLAQSRLIMNAFMFSQFGHCPLIWMFDSRKLNNRINNILERALRIVYRDYE